jgi:tRNA nucleotidyltransferase (CCA-adding enzyme)
VRLILTHENADFDAVAAQVAAHKLDTAATPVLPRRLNRNVRQFISLYWDELPLVRPDDLERQRVERVTIVDTQSIATVRGMKATTPIDFIDHHPQSRKMEPHWSFSGEPIGATTTLLCEGLQERGVALSRVEATLMMLGIYEDTGSLAYGTTTPRDVRCAAWLMEQGADLDVVHEFLHLPLSDDQRALYERLLENAEAVEINGRPVVISTARAPDLVEEISAIAHKLRDLFEPVALFLLVELPTHVQLVARSISEEVEVSQVAACFGGGGHSRAAAALVRDRSLEQARAELLEILPRAIRPRATVADLMSRGVQTVQVTETAAEVERRMRRTGHEGYPALDGDRLVGLLSRHAVDRALDHQRGDMPVAELMDKGTVTVRPEDSVERLQQVMLRSGWGQVPVVDEGGELIGVVTRTDLIKLWGKREDEGAQRAEVIRRLEKALTPETMRLVRRISQTAREMGFELYFVGGFVRDLLLGVPTNNDIDFVIEGDAIALVRRLREAHGGELRSHARFGTAKWIMKNGEYSAAPGLPTAIDFVTARTEFYAHPSALPTVQHSSIKQDLHRRDFTINTLAIRLAPEPFGQLLDFWGGGRDLREGVIRVLHSLSFVDDPTRVLRAARLERRLGFAIEPRTLELIGKALPLLDRVSGDRLRHELEATLREERPEVVLDRLDRLGVLRQIHPALRADKWLSAAMRALRAARRRPAWPALADFDVGWWDLPGFILMTFRISDEERSGVNKRLRVRRRTAGALEKARNLRALLPALEKRQRPSTLACWLGPFSDAVLAAGWAAAPGAVARDQIADYAARLRYVQPLTNGDDLKALGLKPGPRLGRILTRLREAWLDGEVEDAEGEGVLVEKLIAEEAG